MGASIPFHINACGAKSVCYDFPYTAITCDLITGAFGHLSDMKYWEFLIQKEGDRAWLPLETQQVEILEGRYRMVAHTDRANTPVDIQVSQLVTDEMPPRKRVRKRTGQTNESGLVVVMPFVHFKPGQWKVKCSSVDALGDMLDGGWQYGVQLQVFAQSEEDWSNEWPVPDDGQSAGAADESRGDGTALANVGSPLLQAQAELQQTEPDENEAAEQGEPGRAYSVALKQQAYLAQSNQPMTIVGKVSALLGAGDEATSQLWIRLQNPQTAAVIMEAHRPLSLTRLPADFKVQIQLPDDVETRVVLGEVSLRTAAISGERPARILASTAFTITAGIDQILDAIANQDPGTFEEEVSLLSMSDRGTAAEDTLARSEPTAPSFDLSQKAVVPAVGVVLPPQLDKRLDKGLDGEPLESPGEPVARVESSLIDLPTFEQTSRRLSEERLAAGRSAAAETAPLIGAVDRTEASADDEAGLPASDPFDRPAVQPVVVPPMVSVPAQFVGTSIEDSDLEADEITAVLDDIDQDLRDEPSDLDSLEAPGIEGVVGAMSRTSDPRTSDPRTSDPRTSDPRISGPLEIDDDLTDSVPFKSSGEDRLDRQSKRRPSAQPGRKSGREVEANVAFQSLKLKDHFWQRLSSLTRDSHREATKLAEGMAAAGVRRPRSGAALSPLPALDDSYSDGEVVIYDDPPIDAVQAAPQPRSLRQASPAELTGGYGDRADSPDRYPGGGNRTARSRLSESLQERRQQHLGGRDMGQFTGDVGPGSAQTPEQPETPLNADSRAAEELSEMALPVISIPVGDLVAGEKVTVTVRSRPSTFKPFIKLWMVDRQSRSLVIEPKIMTNLTPDALGDLQGTTELEVPRDCLDVQIVAIAIDMATQQESGKAVVNRHIVPAGQKTHRRGRRGGFNF